MHLHRVRNLILSVFGVLLGLVVVVALIGVFAAPSSVDPAVVGATREHMARRVPPSAPPKQSNSQASAAPKRHAPSHTPIDWGSLLVGNKAPAGAKAKLKAAARLAARAPHCAKVAGGFYVPPSAQLAAHRGEPYMITCMGDDALGFNLYYSAADLTHRRVVRRAKPVGKKLAVRICARALRSRYPGARLEASRRYYNASKGSGNVLQVIGVNVENAFGARVERLGRCIITPNRHVDIHLTKG